MSIYVTPQVYRWGTDSRLEINFTSSSYKKALNFTGRPWADRTYRLVKNILETTYTPIICTDTDLIGHDDYIGALKVQASKFNEVPEVVFILTEDRGQFLTCSTIGASAKRLKRAVEELEEAGIKTKYFVNHDAAVRYIERKLKKINGMSIDYYKTQFNMV